MRSALCVVCFVLFVAWRLAGGGGGGGGVCVVSVFVDCWLLLVCSMCVLGCWSSFVT